MHMSYNEQTRPVVVLDLTYLMLDQHIHSSAVRNGGLGYKLDWDGLASVRLNHSMEYMAAEHTACTGLYLH